MKKYLGIETMRLLALCSFLFLSVSVSVVAAPHSSMASWGGDEKKADAHGSHGAGGGWKAKMGGGFFMGGEGFMTARLRAVWSLNLNQTQKTSIRKIQQELRSKHWQLEDKIEVTADKLFELYKADTRNAKAIGKVYAEIFDSRRQIIEIAIEAGNKVEAELTKEQLAKLKKWRPQPKWGG